MVRVFFIFFLICSVYAEDVLNLLTYEEACVVSRALNTYYANPYDDTDIGPERLQKQVTTLIFRSLCVDSYKGRLLPEDGVIEMGFSEKKDKKHMKKYIIMRAKDIQPEERYLEISVEKEWFQAVDKKTELTILGKLQKSCTLLSSGILIALCHNAHFKVKIEGKESVALSSARLYVKKDLLGLWGGVKCSPPMYRVLLSENEKALVEKVLQSELPPFIPLPFLHIDQRIQVVADRNIRRILAQCFPENIDREGFEVILGVGERNGRFQKKNQFFVISTRDEKMWWASSVQEDSCYANILTKIAVHEDIWSNALLVALYFLLGVGVCEGGDDSYCEKVPASLGELRFRRPFLIKDLCTAFGAIA